MWNGKRTEELSQLYDDYYDKYNCEPDWYDEVRYQAFTYEEFVECIKKAIETGKEFPDVIEE